MIEVLVHPQSIIHAMVGFHDGGLMAHLGPADMRHAIGFALNWPQRRRLPVERLDFARLAQLSFEAPDIARFPALRLAREVMNTGGLAGAAFNAAKEVALDHFLAGGIGFLAMAGVVEDVLACLSGECSLTIAPVDVDTILQMDGLARLRAQEAVQRAQRQNRG